MCYTDCSLQKLKKCCDVVTEVLILKTRSGDPDFDTWNYFKQLLELLDVDGMSSEEGTTPVGHQTVMVFFVKVCSWHANEITQYLRIIDQTGAVLAHQNWASPQLASETQGTTIRKGLPWAMYDAQWLAARVQDWADFAEHTLQVFKDTFEVLVLAMHS
jgi:hypothetical protein